MSTHTLKLPHLPIHAPFLLISLLQSLFYLFLLGSYCYLIVLSLHTFPYDSGESHRVHIYLFSSVIPVVAGLKPKPFPKQLIEQVLNLSVTRSPCLLCLPEFIMATAYDHKPVGRGRTKSHKLVLTVPTSIHIHVVCGWLHAVDCDPVL